MLSMGVRAGRPRLSGPNIREISSVVLASRGPLGDQGGGQRMPISVRLSGLVDRNRKRSHSSASGGR